MYTSMNQICTHFRTFKNNSPLFWRYLRSEVLKNKKTPDLKMITGTKILTLSTLFCPPLSKRFPGKILVYKGFPCGSDGKESARNAGDLGSIPGLGRSPGEGKGYPLQYSGLENSPWGHKESDTTERLSLHSQRHSEQPLSYIGFTKRALLLLCSKQNQSS